MMGIREVIEQHRLKLVSTGDYDGIGYPAQSYCACGWTSGMVGQKAKHSMVDGELVSNQELARRLFRVHHREAVGPIDPREYQYHAHYTFESVAGIGVKRYTSGEEDKCVLCGSKP